MPLGVEDVGFSHAFIHFFSFGEPKLARPRWRLELEFALLCGRNLRFSLGFPEKPPRSLQLVDSQVPFGDPLEGAR